MHESDKEQPWEFVDDYSPEEQAHDEAQEVDTTPIDNEPF